MSDGARRLFVGVKISTQLQTGLNSPAPGTDRYFKEDNGEYLQIINQGEDKFIGRYLKDGFPIGDLDNVSRNVRSIIRLIAGDHRTKVRRMKCLGLRPPEVLCFAFSALAIGKRKGPSFWRGPKVAFVSPFLSDELDLRRLQALRALGDFEGNTLPLLKRLVTVLGNLREVNEHVIAALALDEPVALLVAEPLHGPLWHYSS